MANITRIIIAKINAVYLFAITGFAGISSGLYIQSTNIYIGKISTII